MKVTQIFDDKSGELIGMEIKEFMSIEEFHRRWPDLSKLPEID